MDGGRFYGLRFVAWALWQTLKSLPKAVARDILKLKRYQDDEQEEEKET
jgi:hypothetical protein